MRHHATADCRTVTVGIQLDIEIPHLAVLFGVRVAAMHSGMHPVIIG